MFTLSVDSTMLQTHNFCSNQSMCISATMFAYPLWLELPWCISMNTMIPRDDCTFLVDSSSLTHDLSTRITESAEMSTFPL